MCGAEVTRGILCAKCDKPRKPRAQPIAGGADASPAGERGPTPPAAELPQPSRPPSSIGQPSSGGAQSAAAHLESFPEAAVLPFPIESASPSITSIANVLIAGAVPSLVVGTDRLVKFMTGEARRLLNVSGADPGTIREVETATGLRIGELSVPATAALRLHDRNLIFTLVPLSGGASGAVLVFREAERLNDAQASFVSFLKETIFSPLKSMREAMLSASASRDRNPLWVDSAATIDQILSSLEMAPQVKEPSPFPAVPLVVDVLRSVAARFRSLADLKSIGLQVDAADLEERYPGHVQLGDALSALVDNSIHYVPEGGQVVLGVRLMEHKGRPLLLFFVMDNGPLVPEGLRTPIFDPAFEWDSSSTERSGRALFKVRDFAAANGGSVWVESKSGKACTFFMRIRPAR